MDGAKEAHKIWTPLNILQWAVPFLAQKGISNPRLDVELMIAHVLQSDRLKVYLQFDRPLDVEELKILRDMMKRRALREPLQYILGHREFFGLDFKVGPGVLIPRPETELLVEKVLEHLKRYEEPQRLVLDLGTGSGCIAIALAKNIPCRAWATDLSEKALEFGLLNARNLGVAHCIEWRLGNWFEALKPEDPHQYLAIVSNPPYIPYEEKEELSPEVRDFEPPEALFAPLDGTRDYEEISRGLNERLLPGGLALFEIHAKGYDKISNLFSSLGFKETLERDFQGHPRVIKLEK